MIRFFDVACRGRTFNGQAQLHSRGNSRQAILVVSESIPHRIEFLSSPLTPSPWTWLSHRASALANRDYLFTCKTDKDLSWRTIVIFWSLAIRVRSFDRIGVSNDHVRIFFGKIVTRLQWQPRMLFLFSSDGLRNFDWSSHVECLHLRFFKLTI